MYVSVSSQVKSAALGAAAVFTLALSLTSPSLAAERTSATSQRPARARDSFLYPPANSTAELVRAIDKDRTLRLRYARHFHITEDQFLNFVHRALITYKLPAARNVTTYGVTRTGVIYPVRERLPKGTMVWATHSGVPILKWRCANPLTTRIPGLFAKGPRSTPPADKTKTAAADAAPELISTASADALPPVIDTEGLASLLATPPVGDFLLPLAPLSGGGAAGAIFAAAGGGGGGAFPWFVVPFAGMLFPRHSSSTTPPGFFGMSTETITNPPLTIGDTPPVAPPPVGEGFTAVPEAGTSALLLAGALPVAGIVLHRRKNK